MASGKLLVPVEDVVPHVLGCCEWVSFLVYVRVV